MQSQISRMICEPRLPQSAFTWNCRNRKKSLKLSIGILKLLKTGTKLIRMLDRSALSRAFSNLIRNVKKYNDGDLEIILSENGEITFSNMACQ